MDPVQMGKFLARLRRDAGLTQEALGQTLGVTNKTVSRWENGNYLPDLEMLQLLGARFGVSVDELIQGGRKPARTAQNTPERATTEQAVPPQAGAAEPAANHFPLRERIAYWKRKWLREHMFSLVLCYIFLCVLLPIATRALGLAGNMPLLLGSWSLLTLVFYITSRNRMMIYVEARAFLP